MTWMKYVVLIFNILIASPLRAQNIAGEKAIMEPVTLLFEGMNRGDSVMVRRAFTPDAVMATIGKDKNGKTALRFDDLRKFLTAVGTPHPEPWSEPVWDVKIQTDGNLAQVWARYAFYVGKKFSHCGVDAFQLFKGPDGTWKIFFIADTRQSQGCEIPPAISEQFR